MYLSQLSWRAFDIENCLYKRNFYQSYRGETGPTPRIYKVCAAILIPAEKQSWGKKYNTVSEDEYTVC